MNLTVKKVFIILMSICLPLSFIACSKPEAPPPVEPKTTEVQIGENNPLTGDNTLDKCAVGKRPIAVMVENSPAARPQWGLGSADITLEGLVEGGITRMLWIYADAASAPKIGPTRSARIDYIEWAEGLDAIFVHFGGASNAYEALRTRKVDNIDGIGKGNLKGGPKYFKRDDTRRNRGIEHSAYTTGEWLSKAISETGVRYDINLDYIKPFAFFSTTTKLKDGECTSITFAFSSNYKHTFKYNSEDNLYYNWMNTSEMLDENGNQMAVTNVILLYMPVTPIPGASGWVNWDQTGGDGIIVSSGSYENITWTKGNTPGSMLKIFDSAGYEMKLNVGKSYIGIVPLKNVSLTTIA
ncbi:MAG: DUF3048 domain-containing protein [Ruminococcaceae bacterium]|nr:DUF3048 domain-containing protein [Oscillospiraceae bacterium]